MDSKKDLQKRIRYLQRILVQLSFNTSSQRLAIYTSTLNSLKKIQEQLISMKQEKKECHNE